MTVPAVKTIEAKPTGSKVERTSSPSMGETERLAQRAGALAALREAMVVSSSGGNHRD